MRILVFGMTENPGGVESFLVNYYRHIDRNKIQWDFLCNSHNPVAYEDEPWRSVLPYLGQKRRQAEISAGA